MAGNSCLLATIPLRYIAQIFFKMLDYKDLIPCCTGMIQREVALRMAAQPRQQDVWHSVGINPGVVRCGILVYGR